MLVTFLAVTDGPRSPIVGLAALAILAVAYSAVRGLSLRTEFTAEAGVFRCATAGLWPRSSTEVALTDVDGFEGRAPEHSKDVAHVVLRLRNREEIRLTTVVADASILSATELARAIATALDALVDDARRRTRGYRVATNAPGEVSRAAGGADVLASDDAAESSPPARETRR